jgi:hypothetical protein
VIIRDAGPFINAALQSHEAKQSRAENGLILCETFSADSAGSARA